MLFIDDSMRGAVFSADRKYRYSLWRRWTDCHVKEMCVFIGLNPSTADETKDDPTIRRCIQFSKDWGYGGLVMLNLFAFRATDPKAMKVERWPIGVDNDECLCWFAKEAGRIVAAWGTHGAHLLRDEHVLKRCLSIRDPLCLGVTKDGHPRHPLYVKGDTRPKFLEDICLT